jgi:hypothetical protein
MAARLGANLGPTLGAPPRLPDQPGLSRGCQRRTGNSSWLAVLSNGAKPTSSEMITSSRGTVSMSLGRRCYP